MSRYPRYYGNPDIAKCDHCGKTFAPVLLRPEPIKRRGKSTIQPTTEQTSEYYESVQQAADMKDRHVRSEHADIFIATRMAEIEHEAKMMAWQGEDTRDWKTDPLAVEYRALLKEWWSKPVSEAAARLSPSRRRYLTAKSDVYRGDGLVNADTWFSRDRKKLLAKAATSAQLVGTWMVLDVKGTRYQFLPEVCQKALANAS